MKTHRRDLHCISLPEMALSLGLKRLSTKHIYSRRIKDNSKKEKVVTKFKISFFKFYSLGFRF